MRILVTGAAGTVGKATVEQLSKYPQYKVIATDLDNKHTRQVFRYFNNRVKTITADLTQPDTIKPLVKDQDVIIHLAAVIPPLADEQPELARQVNVEGTRHLLKLAGEQAAGCFFIYGSSISVYGDRLANPWIKVGDPLQPSVGDEYAVTKIAAEKLVQESDLDYTILRITAVMGGDNHQISKLMFHMPLDTPIELITPDDAGRAFAAAVTHREDLKGRIFNLSGGEACRISYRELLARSFHIAGLGRFDLPEESFARCNFHCGYYADGDQLEDILHFRHDTAEEFFRLRQAATKPFTRWLTILLRPLIKKRLLAHSEPLQALRNNDKALISRFFGNS